MGVNLKEEAAKLEVALSGGAATKPSNLLYRKFQVRAYEVSFAAGRTVNEIETEIGRRAVVERILRGGEDVEPRADTTLQAGDEILLAGPSAVIVSAKPLIGTEIEGEHVMRSVPGDVLEVFVTARDLHGRTLADIVERLGDIARGVFLRELKRRGQEVPITPGTQIYVGDVMTSGRSHSRPQSRRAPNWAAVSLQRPHRHRLSCERSRCRTIGWIVQSHGQVNSAHAGRGRRRAHRRADLRLVAFTPTYDGSVSAGRAAISERSRTRWICRRYRARKWTGRIGSN